MSKNYDSDEPVIEVTATPIGGGPKTLNFPLSTESATVSGSTVPMVAGEEPDKAVQFATVFLDHIKEKYSAEEYNLVVKFSEKEEIDRGWFSHVDVGGGIDFEGGKWEAKIKGTPKKITRKKETTIRIGLEKKEGQ
jgi:hypothetical protein